MKTRKIGQLEVSEIGMGCMGFSHGYGTVPDELYSIGAIQAAYAYGCNFFDTAEGYGKEQFTPGHNEKLLGKAVKEFRSDVILATKLRIEPEEIENRSIYDAVRDHVEHSLQNLNTDYIDLYYLHRVNTEVPVEEIAEAMGRIKKEGYIREWGMSAVSTELLNRAEQVTHVAAVQNIYNILERDCEEEIFPYCLEKGIAVVPFSPIGSGFLSGRITSETQFEKHDDVRNWVPQLSRENIRANQPIVDILNKYAGQKQATAAQISLAWMLHKYPNVVPIPGSKNKTRILENLAACHVKLTDEEFSSLEKDLESCTVYGHRGCVETENRTEGYNR